MTRTARNSLLLGCVLALTGHCRVGYDESKTLGTDQALEGEWRWTDGSLFWLGGPTPGGMAQNGLFVAWYFREPNNVSMAEHCASLDTTGSTPEWYDTRCELVQPFVCESL